MPDSLKTVQNALKRFLDTNTELVDDYKGDVDLYDLIPDIAQKFTPSRLHSSTVHSIMREALLECNENGDDILDCVDHALNSDFECKNTIQMFFKDIGKIYDKHKNDFNIEYTKENRDSLIGMNLKTVISVAKKYQGAGVPLEDLIQAGCEGLCKAFDKFKPDKTTIKDIVLSDFESVFREFSTNSIKITGEQALSVVTKHISYGKFPEKFQKRFVGEKTYKYTTIYNWIDKNLKSAKFSSVAFQWIKAFVLNEIDRNGRLVKKPKTDIYRDREKTGTFTKETTVNMDDFDNDHNPVLGTVENLNNLDLLDDYNYYKSNIRKILKPLSARERSILLKRFGIGIPRAATPKEIATIEGLTVARVSQIFQIALQKVREEALRLDIDPSEMFNVCKSFK